jgi:Tol biopolymer transport system component
MLSTRKTLRTIGLAAAATLALAGTASADSISFIRGGDIWVASPDGAKQVQITHSGAYSYQSQADDGTFIALSGRRLHKIDRQGNVVADFSTPVSAGEPDPYGSYFLGPFDPEISPDGKKVVYTYYWQYSGKDPNCVGPDWYCKYGHLYQGVGYSASDRSTGWDEEGFGRQSGWIHPSWLSNDRVMTSDPSEIMNVEVKYDDVNPDNQSISDWFTDEGVADIEDGEVNRQKTMAVFLDAGAKDETGQSEASRISFYRMTGDEPAAPERCYTLGYAEGRYEGPSWAPSGDRIAVVDRKDQGGKLLVIPVVDRAGGCQTPADFSTQSNTAVTIDDARHADWGPADVPAVKEDKPQQQPQQPVGEQQRPQQPTKPAGSETAKPVTTKRAVALRGRKLATALKRGVVVRFSAPAAGTVNAKAVAGGRTVAKGSARSAKAGPVAVKLRFDARARRTLRTRRSVRLSVRLTFAGA